VSEFLWVSFVIVVTLVTSNETEILTLTRSVWDENF